MSKGKGIKPYGAIVRRGNNVNRNAQNTSTRRNRIEGQKGLPSKTTTIVDAGDGWTYEA